MGMGVGVGSGVGVGIAVGADVMTITGEAVAVGTAAEEFPSCEPPKNDPRPPLKSAIVVAIKRSSTTPSITYSSTLLFFADRTSSCRYGSPKGIC